MSAHPIPSILTDWHLEPTLKCEPSPGVFSITVPASEREPLARAFEHIAATAKVYTWTADSPLACVALSEIEAGLRFVASDGCCLAIFEWSIARDGLEAILGDTILFDAKQFGEIGKFMRRAKDTITLTFERTTVPVADAEADDAEADPPAEDLGPVRISASTPDGARSAYTSPHPGSLAKPFDHEKAITKKHGDHAPTALATEYVAWLAKWPALFGADQVRILHTEQADATHFVAGTGSTLRVRGFVMPMFVEWGEAEEEAR